MKQRLIVLSITLFIGQLIYQSAFAQTNSVPQAILKDGEVVGFKIEGIGIRPWWKGTDNKGKLEETRGLEQYAVIQGIKVRIHYTEFDSAEDSHQAAEFYSKNMASVFYSGLWDGAQTKSIGDEVWYFSDVTTGLLVRSGRTCFLISCRDGDVEKRKQVAELLAKQIEQKIMQGGRVIVPSDSQKDGISHPSTNSLTK